MTDLRKTPIPAYGEQCADLVQTFQSLVSNPTNTAILLDERDHVRSHDQAKLGIASCLLRNEFEKFGLRKQHDVGKFRFDGS